MGYNSSMKNKTMETKAEKQWDILIIPCWGESYLSRLIIKAAEELTAQNKVRILQEGEIDDLETVKEAIRHSDRCITVDGCDKHCMIKKMNEQQCRTEFNLNLVELGIDDRQQTDLHPEDLELAQNGILAASSRISPKHPVFPGCCC